MDSVFLIVDDHIALGQQVNLGICIV
jgi:hypothetical protein